MMINCLKYSAGVILRLTLEEKIDIYGYICMICNNPSKKPINIDVQKVTVNSV